MLLYKQCSLSSLFITVGGKRFYKAMFLFDQYLRLLIFCENGNRDACLYLIAVGKITSIQFNIHFRQFCREPTTIMKQIFCEFCFKVGQTFADFYSSLDPTTKKWLAEVMDPVFGYPHFVRFSWSTCSNILESKAAAVEW